MEDIEMGDDSLLVETPPSANEIDRLRYQITLKNVGKALQSAADIAFPNDTRQQYTEVYVLLITWKEEDFRLPVEVEVEPLRNVFFELYGFETEIWHIPNENSHNELNRRVLDFVSLGGDSRDHLKIVYYAGHGMLTKNRRAAWASCGDRKSPQYKTVKWAGVQNVLEEARSDVLLLLDCCASGCANTEDGRGTTELIAACGFESIANPVGSYSFTQALTTELRILGRRAPFLPFTVGALYNRILTRLQTHMPEGRETQRSPLHVVLTQNQNLPRAIQMAVKPKPRTEMELRQDAEVPAQTLQPTASGGTSNILSSTVHGDSTATASIFSRTTSLGSSASSAQSQFETPRIVLTIHLKETISDSAESVGQLDHWLRMMPVVAEKVKIEAGFMSFSTLLFVSLPVEMWCYLAKDPAIMPAGLIRSQNLIAIQQCQNAQTTENEIQPKTSSSSTITGTLSTKSTTESKNNPIGSPRNSTHELLDREEPEQKRTGIPPADSNTTGKNAMFTSTLTLSPSANIYQKTLKSGEDLKVDSFSRLSPKTHDISLSEKHISSIKHLAADLNEAVRIVWPNRHNSRYERVHVLLLRWADDDLGFLKEINELCRVFKDAYHYDVQIYEIPSVDPKKSVLKRLFEFLGHDGPSVLLIVYYAGYAKHDPYSTEFPIWFANQRDSYLDLPSSRIQSQLEEADSDVLLLYDCGFSAAKRTTGSFRGNSTKEVIAACGYETISPEVGKHSFTHALIQALAFGSKGPPFSVSELHSRVLSRLKCWRPVDGNFVASDEGKLQYERQPPWTPIYSILYASEPRRSIILQPMKSNSLASEDQPQSPSSVKIEPTPESNMGEILKKRKDDDFRCPQVLLAVRLEKAEFNAQTWREFIRSAPAEAQDIRIEGIYDSFSTLILVKMPVTTWNLLPQNPAYSFVGFVTSRNNV